MNLYSLYAWFACFNIALTILFMTELSPGRWFSRCARTHDGHIVGAIFKWWAIICFFGGIVMLVAGWNSHDAMKPFVAVSKDPRLALENIMPFARMSMSFMIFTNIIPYIIGREVRSGLKIFRE